MTRSSSAGLPAPHSAWRWAARRAAAWARRPGARELADGAAATRATSREAAHQRSANRAGWRRAGDDWHGSRLDRARSGGRAALARHRRAASRRRCRRRGPCWRHRRARRGRRGRTAEQYQGDRQDTHPRNPEPAAAAQPNPTQSSDHGTTSEARSSRHDSHQRAELPPSSAATVRCGQPAVRVRVGAETGAAAATRGQGHLPS